MRKQQRLPSSGRSHRPRLYNNKCHSRRLSKWLLRCNINRTSMFRRLTRQISNSQLRRTIKSTSTKLSNSHSISSSLLRRSNKAVYLPRLANKRPYKTTSNLLLKLLRALQARVGWTTIAWVGAKGRNRTQSKFVVRLSSRRMCLVGNRSLAFATTAWCHWRISLDLRRCLGFHRWVYKSGSDSIAQNFQCQYQK